MGWGEDSVQEKAIFLECFTFKFEQIHSCVSQDIYMEEYETQRRKMECSGIFLQMGTAGEAATCKRINISRINLSSCEGRLLGARVIRMNLI